MKEKTQLSSKEQGFTTEHSRVLVYLKKTMKKNKEWDNK
jgi:hypothetical protein